MPERFTFSPDPTNATRRWHGVRRCFSCERLIRDYETGYEATGLCEDCQLEAEQQAERDNDATFEEHAYRLLYPDDTD